MEILLIAVLTFGSAFLMTIALMSVLGLVEDPIDRRLESDRHGEAYEHVNQRIRQERFKRVIENVGQRVAPTSEADVNDCKRRLQMAGYYHESAVAAFWGSRIVLILCLLLLALTTVPFQSKVPPAIVLLLAAGIGFILPDLFIRFKTKKRHEQIFRGLPDALDLLVVCLESGLGLDSALQKVSEEFHISNPELSEELRMTCASIRLGQPRSDALHDLGKRTGVMDLKALAAVLIQSDRFGTSSADALRVHAADMRTRRRQRAEEMAAKTTVKLIFPLVLFIFPSIFVVLGGPAVIKIMESLVNQ